MTTHLNRRDFVTVLHLQHAWVRAGAERLDPHNAVSAERRVFDILCDRDPTGGRYLGWLSNWRRHAWRIRGLRSVPSIGELRELGEVMDRFADHCRHLPVAWRDIGRLRSVAEIKEALDRLEATPGMKQAARERERRQSKILLSQDGWTIIELLGPDAARRWSWGTRWCTGSSQERYERYRLSGDLFVIDTPVGRYQLASGTGEFKDAADRPQEISAVLQEAPTVIRSTVLERLRPAG